MNYVELENKINSQLTIPLSRRKMAEIIGTSAQNLNKKFHNEKTQVVVSDVEKLENALAISLMGTNDNFILDYYPDTFGSCGTGVFEFSTKKTQLAVPKNAFFTNISTSKQYFVINAYGDSMQPLIYDKDKLIIEHWEGEQIIDNRPYVFCYKDEIFIKKLVKNINQLVILPENKEYDTIKLSGSELSDVDIIGRVVGLMRDLK